MAAGFGGSGRAGGSVGFRLLVGGTHGREQVAEQSARPGWPGAQTRKGRDQAWPQSRAPATFLLTEAHALKSLQLPTARQVTNPQMEESLNEVRALGTQSPPEGHLQHCCVRDPAIQLEPAGSVRSQPRCECVSVRECTCGWVCLCARQCVYVSVQDSVSVCQCVCL